MQGKDLDWNYKNKGKGKQINMFKDFLGKKVIVRGDRSGVFFGTLESKEGKEEN